MSLNNLKPYQKHLIQFSLTPSSPPYNVTILSALKRLLSLGLNFPIAFGIAVGLPIICNPFPYYWRPVNVLTLSGEAIRTHLENCEISENSNKTYSLSEIIKLFQIDQSKRKSTWIGKIIDLAHVISFWAMAANQSTGLVSTKDLNNFIEGEWTNEVVIRRKSRLEGKRDIIPPWRGGPVIVSAHSWFVRKLFGVHVYEAK